MKISKITFLLLIVGAKNLLGTEIVGGIGYQNYTHNNYSSFSAISPSVEIYVPVYKNLSAGFGLFYANINYGSSNELANSVGYSGGALEGNASHGIIPLQLALRYDYEFQKNWKFIGVLRAGLSAGRANYYKNSTVVCGFEPCNPMNVTETNIDELEISTDKILGFDIGLSYKKYAFFAYYSAMGVVNTYSNANTTVTSTVYQNKNNTTMQAIGFKIAYLFDF